MGDAVDKMADNAHKSWGAAYGSMPEQVRSAVPRELRPEALSPVPKPGPEPKRPAAAEPKPAPAPKCDNCVAITFDDGPVPDTNRLLDILKRKNVHATFFVLGINAEAYAPTLRRIRDEGHTIGNHTDNHPKLPALSDAAIAHQIDISNRTIRIVTGQTPRWMRPPYGEYDNRVVNTASERNLSLAMWDVDTLDWQHRNPAQTCSSAVAGAQPGSIVLMHDIHAPTVDAVECVIDGLRAKGLRPVGLDELIPKPEAGRIYTAKQ